MSPFRKTCQDQQKSSPSITNMSLKEKANECDVDAWKSHRTVNIDWNFFPEHTWARKSLQLQQPPPHPHIGWQNWSNFKKLWDCWIRMILRTERPQKCSTVSSAEENSISEQSVSEALRQLRPTANSDRKADSDRRKIPTEYWNSAQINSLISLIA